MFDNKYGMSVEDNILFAKRNLIDSIYKIANLEGIAVTFPETYDLFEGRNVAHLSVDEVVKVNNLKHAWQFIFDTVDYPVDMRYIKQINFLVGQSLIFQPGVIRTSSVGIGGTSWRPDIPNEENVLRSLESILSSEDAITEKAMDIMLYLMRSQLFVDGNKRTAQLVANKFLIQHGAGLMVIPVELQSAFLEKLVAFYETGNAEEIKVFLYTNACIGYNAEPSEEIEQEEFEQSM